MNQFRDVLPPQKRCIANGCTSMYSHEWDGYLWSGFDNAKLLSSTCRTTNISVAMVDNSPPKFCLNFWRILYILENSALQKVAYLCIHVSMDDMTEQSSIVLSCWATHVELQIELGWIVPGCVSLLQPHLPNATIMSSECSNTGEFYPHIPLQTFQRVFAGTRCSYIFSTSM